MSACVECETVIARESESVTCAGKCKKAWHLTCSGLTKSGIHAMCENSVLLYVCFDCRKDLGKTKPKEMSEKNARECTCTGLNDQCLKQMEVVWKEIIRKELEPMTVSLLAQIEGKIKDVIHCELNNKLKVVEKSVPVEIAKTSLPIPWSKVVATKTKKVNVTNEKGISTKNSLEEEPGMLRNGKRRRLASREANGKGDDISLARSSHGLNDVTEPKSSITKLNETVCFKPKQSQSVDVSRSELRSAIDPIKSGVRSVHYVETTGEVFVRCNSSESALKMINDAQKDLGNRYEIKIRKAHKPKLRIVGFEEEQNDEKGCCFVEKLKKQNNLAENAQVTVLKIYKNEKWKNSSSIAIVEVDADTFESLIKREKVNIGWDRCKVYEAISVLRCFKCWNFGHKSADCRENFCCPRCAGRHELKDCQAEFEKCTNCEKFNLKRNPESEKLFHVDHPAWSYECEVFKKKQNKAKRFVDYGK